MATIVERLKALIAEKGGTTEGVMTIEQAVKKLTDLEAAASDTDDDPDAPG